MSPLALRRITSRKKPVSNDVFSSRLVVASINVNVLVRAAYGTLRSPFK